MKENNDYQMASDIWGPLKIKIDEGTKDLWKRMDKDTMCEAFNEFSGLIKK